MVKLRRIGLFSAARFGFWLGFSLLFAEILVALFMLALNGIPPTSLPPEIWTQVAQIIFFNGVLMAFSVFVFAMIYNWSNGIFGALELEFEMPTPPLATEEKAKNEMFEED